MKENEKTIENSLTDAFVKIMKKHGNPAWAYDELEWLVFVNHKEEFNQLNEQDTWTVRHFMDALKKIHK